jgi:hypothetical protein
MVRGNPLLRLKVREHPALILKPSAHLQSSRRIRGELNHYPFALARFFSKLLATGAFPVSRNEIPKTMSERFLIDECSLPRVSNGGPTTLQHHSGHGSGCHLTGYARFGLPVRFQSILLEDAVAARGFQVRT